MPRYQTGVNVAVPPAGVLSGAITAIQTTITLTDASLFPDPSPAYPIVVYGTVSAVQHTEYMLVTGKSSNTLTVVRANEDAVRYPAYAFPATGDASTNISVDMGLTATLLNWLATKRLEPIVATPTRVYAPITDAFGDPLVAIAWGPIFRQEFVMGLDFGAPELIYTADGDILVGEA